MPWLPSCIVFFSRASQKLSSYIRNSYDLVDKLNSKIIEEHDQLMSLDVVSLFTNVSIELAIKSIEKRWHRISENTSIPYNEFLTGIRLVLGSTYFVFNGSIYKQTFVTRNLPSFRFRRNLSSRIWRKLPSLNLS